MPNFRGQTKSIMAYFCSTEVAIEFLWHWLEIVANFCTTGQRWSQNFSGPRQRWLQNFCGTSQKWSQNFWGTSQRGQQNFCGTNHFPSFVSKIAEFLQVLLHSVKIDMKTLSKPILENHKIVLKALKLNLISEVFFMLRCLFGFNLLDDS